MAGYRDRLAENAGASLAAAGAVLALGAALGALGLSEAQRLDRSPFHDPLVWAALVLIGIATGWCLLSFGIAMRTSLKTQVFREQLGRAIDQGKRLRYGGDGTPGHYGTPDDPVLWERRCRALLEAGLGAADARAFVVERNEDRIAEDPWNFLALALDRLVVIFDRPNLRARFAFDHKRDWMER